MSESQSLSQEQRLRLAELAMQLTLAATSVDAIWGKSIDRGPLANINENTECALRAFDLIYDHLACKVGMQ